MTSIFFRPIHFFLSEEDWHCKDTRGTTGTRLWQSVVGSSKVFHIRNSCHLVFIAVWKVNKGRLHATSCLHNATSWHRHVNSGTEARAELMWMFPWTFFSTTQDIFRLSSLTTSLLLGMSAVARRHKYGKVIGSHWECVVAIFYLKMFLNVSRMFGAWNSAKEFIINGMLVALLSRVHIFIHFCIFTEFNSAETYFVYVTRFYNI